jgi:mono/diheme cytochrome c family protein
MFRGQRVMIGRVRLCGMVLAFAVLVALATGAVATDGASDGKALLEQNCGRCHALGATGSSPLAKAPPLREAYLNFPIEEWELGLAEGWGSRHRDMPQIQFSSEQVATILDYLGSIAGVAPSERQRAPVPRETPP